MSTFHIYRRLAVLTAVVIVTVGVLFASTGYLHSHHARVQDLPNKASPATLLNTYGKLPLVFEANQGQSDGSVKFLTRGNGYSLFLTTGGPVLALGDKTGQGMLYLHLVGANADAQVVGLDELPGKVSYFVGNDARMWRSGIPTYAQVMYRNVYPGVNLVFYGNQEHLEYDFVLTPGANPNIIQLNFEGAKNLKLDSQGNLALSMQSGQIFQAEPDIYQEIGGAKHAISGHYVLRGTNLVGFDVAGYDSTRPLVID